MDRLTERNKHGVAVMRLDLPAGLDRSPVARLADYEDSGIPPEKVAVIGWVGRTVWVLKRCVVCGELSDPDVFDGRVKGVYFGGYISPENRVKVEVMFGNTINSFNPEDVFLTREDAEAALAQIKERER